jgi:hypothetical protein
MANFSVSLNPIIAVDLALHALTAERNGRVSNIVLFTVPGQMFQVGTR